MNFNNLNACGRIETVYKKQNFPTFTILRLRINLYKHKTIRSFSALLMLLIFTMSITPKVFLHDLTADHKDEVSVVLHCHDQHLDKVGFTCDCNNLVSTSPYTVEPVLNIPEPQAIVLVGYTPSYAEKVYAATTIFSSLRGPPATRNLCFI